MHIQVYKWECALLLKNIKVDGAGALKPVQGGPDRLKGWVKTMMVEMNVVLISSQNYGLTGAKAYVDLSKCREIHRKAFC